MEWYFLTWAGWPERKESVIIKSVQPIKRVRELLCSVAPDKASRLSTTYMYWA